MQTTKHLLQSKTVNTNLISLIAVLGTYFGTDLDAETQAALSTGLLAIVNVASIIFRYVSNSNLRL